MEHLPGNVLTCRANARDVSSRFGWSREPCTVRGAWRPGCGRFEAMRAAIASARVRGAEYEPKALDVLRWSTTGGASVLRLGDRSGCIEPGRKADLILLDRSHPNLSPVIDGVGIVVHSGRGSNVDTVIVDGRVLIEGGRATAFDGDGIVAEAQVVAEKLWARHGTQAVTLQSPP